MSPKKEREPIRPGEEKALEALLREMGPKDDAPSALRERVKEAVEAEWRSVVAGQKPPTPRQAYRHRFVLRPAWAMAASVALAALVVWSVPRYFAAQAPVTVASLDRSVGSVEVQADKVWHPANAGLQLRVGQQLVTGPQSRAQLSWPNGTTLRLDVNSTIAIKTAERVTLARGAVYIDAAGDSLPDGLPQIDSELGSVRHVGTQYEVRLGSDEMVVSVREGRVEVTGTAGRLAAAAGEQIEIAANGTVERRPIARRDPQWAWVEAVSPGFAIEQRRLSEFLGWVARETGRDLKFTSSDAEATAGSIVLRGSVAGLDPEAAIAAVMATTSLRYSADDREITIAAGADGSTLQ